VARRQSQVQTDGGAGGAFAMHACLQTYGEIAKATGTADGREQATVADGAVGEPEEVCQGVRRTEADDGGVGCDLQAVAYERHGDRYIEPVGHADRDEGRKPGDRRFDRVEGRDNVLPSAEKLGVVVGEDGGNLEQVESFHGIKAEVLRCKPEGY